MGRSPLACTKITPPGGIMYAHVHACKHGCEARVCEASAPGCTTNAGGAEKSRPGANLAIAHEADLTTLIMLLVGQSRHSAQLFCPLPFKADWHIWHMKRSRNENDDGHNGSGQNWAILQIDDQCTVTLFAGKSNRTCDHLSSENVKLLDGFCPFAASDKKIVHLSWQCRS